MSDGRTGVEILHFPHLGEGSQRLPAELSSSYNFLDNENLYQLPSLLCLTFFSTEIASRINSLPLNLCLGVCFSWNSN